MSLLLPDSERDCHHIYSYPYSRCQQTQRPRQVHSAESAWFSSAGGVGRRHHVSETDESHSVNYGRGNSGFQSIVKLIILSYPCTLKRHLSWRVVVAVNHHAYLGWTALELDNLKDWYTRNTPADNYTTYLEARVMLQALKSKYFLTSVMWDSLDTKWTSLPVKEQHSCVHIHRNSLSAIPHHLHLDTHRKTTLNT